MPNSESTNLINDLVLAILRREHQHFVDESTGDDDYIPSIRRIIESALSVASKTIPKAEARKLAESWRGFSKDLFVAECISNAQEDEDPEVFRAESEEAFDSIFNGD